MTPSGNIRLSQQGGLRVIIEEVEHWVAAVRAGRMDICKVVGVKASDAFNNRFNGRSEV